MKTELLFIHALSPLHAGTGRGAGVIDMPIAREKATGIPFLPGTTLKGVFRDGCDNAAVRKRVFGPDTSDDPSEHAGSATFTDARLVLMPIRSLRGVFAWVTSPLLLRRLARDAQGQANHPTAIPDVTESACLTCEPSSPLVIQVNNVDKVILEDLPLDPSGDDTVKTWADWLGPILFSDDTPAQADFAKRFCVISDDAMSFLLEIATEITARIRIEDSKKTVTEGGLWYEEALPTETVLVSQVVWTNVKSDQKEVFNTVRGLTESILQFGGKATVGRGLCRAIPVWEVIA